MFQSLIYPMFAMVLITFGVAMLMLRARIAGVRAGRVDVRYFKTYQGTIPADIAQRDRHFTNLFELPVIFYVVCLAAMVVRVDGMAMMALAWAFVVLRALHAFIHIGANKLQLRMAVYGLQWTVILLMWIVLVLALNAR